MAESIKTQKRRRLSILIYSCWKNADMWEIFSTLFERYWTDCDYERVLVTDCYHYSDDKRLFDRVICVDGSWYEMITTALHEVKSDYVMLMMDDYLLCDHVDSKTLEHIMDDADRYNAANIRFINSDIHLEKKSFEQDSAYDIYTPGKAYSITTQIGVWNSEVLLEYMRPEWSAWDFERKGSLEISDEKHPLLGTKSFQFPYVEGVRKGKWMKQGIDICEKNGIFPDFSKSAPSTDL